MFRNVIKVCYDSIKMVMKNIRTYALLSVTLVISFSGLGIYLLYTDSSIFNENKEYLKMSPNVVMSDYYDSDKENIALLKKQLDKMENTHYQTSLEIRLLRNGAVLPKKSMVEALSIHAIPNNTWAYYYNDVNRAETVNGEKKFNIKSGEAIVCESLYNMLEKEEDSNDCYVYLPFASNGREVLRKFKVIDVCKDMKQESTYITEYGNVRAEWDIFVSYDDYKDATYGDRYFRLQIYSDKIENVVENIIGKNLSFETPLYGKQNAYNNIINSIHIKMVIVIAILILLGINLYSCFSNALSERKFEIGVKRAIGASKLNIIFQFFVEGIVVMVTDMIISVCVIITALSGIKLYKYIVDNENWSIIINDYSIIIYIICCAFLSLFFSLIFAYMTTTVEIVKQLKNE